MNRVRPSRAKLVSAALLATILVAAAVAVYHALDSWYLQSANASRLRADYSEIAATRFSEHASQALATARTGTDSESLFAGLFRTVRLLPSGVPSPGGNAAAFAIEVTDLSGRTIFRSGNPAAQPFVARDTIATSGHIVSVAARKSAVAWLATEHLASRMMVILWLIVLTAVAAVFAIRSIRKEARLAQARSDFVSSVSHELRTPLAQIQILLETLRLGRFNTDAQREWTFEGMQRELTRLTGLVDNVMRFSTAERNGSGRPVRPRATNMTALLHEIVEGFRPLADSQRVTISEDIESDMTAWIDPDAMRQVILNLLDNAVKHGPEGQTIQLSAAHTGAVMKISITDEGMGVPGADRIRIWNAFERGSNVTGSGIAGSGIGLAVVRDIVSAHRGSVRVDDAGNAGARFVIEIPDVHPTGNSDDMPARHA